MKYVCLGCGKEINSERETYWVVYPEKIFCGVVCYKKDDSKEKAPK